MLDEVPDGKFTRSPLDIFHFAVVSIGVVIALAGVILASIRIALFGLVLVAWGLTYFYAEPEPMD